MNKEAKTLMSFAFAMMIVLPIVSYNSGFNNAMKNRQQPSADFPAWEVTEIMDACYRNSLDPQLVPIVYAIRKAENGRPELAFGIMNLEADSYTKQAGDDSVCLGVAAVHAVHAVHAVRAASAVHAADVAAHADANKNTCNIIRKWYQMDYLIK